MEMAEPRVHEYRVAVRWTGSRGMGTTAYRAYARSFDIVAPGKPIIPGSADPAFRGDPTRHNPEEMLVSAVSSCHMLRYLHLCADAGVVVTDYWDNALGKMTVPPDGHGRFTSITLYPAVTVADEEDIERAERIHADAHQSCFIANSVDFPVHCVPRTLAVGDSQVRWGAD